MSVFVPLGQNAIVIPGKAGPYSSRGRQLRLSNDLWICRKRPIRQMTAATTSADVGSPSSYFGAYFGLQALELSSKLYKA